MQRTNYYTAHVCYGDYSTTINHTNSCPYTVDSDHSTYDFTIVIERYQESHLEDLLLY